MMIILKKSKSALKRFPMLLAVGVVAIMMAGCGPNDPGDDNTKVGTPTNGEVTTACQGHVATCAATVNKCLQNNTTPGGLTRGELKACAAQVDTTLVLPE
jgi:hypothetical protein